MSSQTNKAKFTNTDAGRQNKKHNTKEEKMTTKTGGSLHALKIILKIQYKKSDHKSKHLIQGGRIKESKLN